MRYGLIIILFILTSCISSIKKNNDTELNIDIYKSDMTYEQFKQYAIDYAEKAPYPSLTNK
jgi:hypothetical protein|tara:strand:+ start:3678 stop:3860 length:183 start_codon:yes stop_codon:yes gene_type:complete